MSPGESFTTQLALHDPEEYERLLHGFFLLLGERRPWWERCADADDPSWQGRVRSAIVAVAKRSGASPLWLADFLDNDSSVKARERVLRLARSGAVLRRSAA